jgi:hypothetical protein
MDTIYFLFGSKTVKAYNEGGFEALKQAIADFADNDWNAVAFDHDMTPNALLDAFRGFEDYTEIEYDEFNELVGN